jgi:hypothetical protein
VQAYQDHTAFLVLKIVCAHLISPLLAHTKSLAHAHNVGTTLYCTCTYLYSNCIFHVMFRLNHSLRVSFRCSGAPKAVARAWLSLASYSRSSAGEIRTSLVGCWGGGREADGREFGGSGDSRRQESVYRVPYGSGVERYMLQ